MSRKVKDILVSSSTGLVKDATGNYFMQIILSENEYDNREREDLFVPITEREAKALSRQHSIEISNEDSTISMYNSSIVETIKG